MSTASEESSVSPPEERSVSRGSSVSSSLRDEYEDLLRYAVVTPIVGAKLPSKGGPGLKKTETARQGPKPHSNTPKRVVQPEISKVDFDEELSVTPSESEQSPPPLAAPQHSVGPSGAGRSREPSHRSGDPIPVSHDEEEEQQPQVMDPEIARLENQLDVWCLDLKRNVIAEFDQARIRIGERHQSELLKERQQQAYEMRQLQGELERCKELLVTYEQSIARKDHIIANLTRGLQKQKEKVELQKSFSSWKLRHTDERRESFTGVLAARHHNHKLKSRVWAAWFGVIQTRWKNRVEKACQSKAEEVCVQLTQEYEERLAAVHRSLDDSQQEVSGLKAERALYEENMKKAFMRGVCALNLEAMSMFRGHETSAEGEDHLTGDENHDPTALPPEGTNDTGIPPQGTVPLLIRPPNGLAHSTTTENALPQQRIHLTASATAEGSNQGGDGSYQKWRAAEEGRKVKKSGSLAPRQLPKGGPHKKRDAPSVMVQRHQVN